MFVVNKCITRMQNILSDFILLIVNDRYVMLLCHDLNIILYKLLDTKLFGQNIHKHFSIIREDM